MIAKRTRTWSLRMYRRVSPRQIPMRPADSLLLLGVGGGIHTVTQETSRQGWKTHAQRRDAVLRAWARRARRAKIQLQFVFALPYIRLYVTGWGGIDIDLSDPRRP